MTPKEKNNLLDKLSVAYNRANHFKAVAEESKDAASAAQLGRRMDRLRLEIDGLLRDFYDDWIGDADALAKDILNRNQLIQDSLDRIEANKESAKNFVQVIAYLDDVIELAAALVK